MYQELFQICQLQLRSIIEESNSAVSGATASASNCLASLERLDSDGAANAEVPELRKNLDAIITRLQFEDELTQRLVHIIEMLAIAEERIARDKGPTTEKETAVLIEKLQGILSIRSEFEQLEKVFPTLAPTGSVESIELF